MIGIVDYGVGNLASISNALNSLGIKSKITSKLSELSRADAIILPGDGAAGEGMKNLKKMGINLALVNEIKKGKPFLGICLGMQLLMNFSQEGNVAGLGIIKGSVEKLQTDLKIPQIGWNNVKIKNFKSRIMQDIPSNAYFYFINSYVCKPKDDSIIFGETTYGETFCSVFEKGKVFGVQFHPEKSGNAGMQLLKNFLEEL